MSRQTLSYEEISVPSPLFEWTQKAMKHFEADILGLDFLETRDGQFFCLESNDIPGLSGFPGAARVVLANLMRERIYSYQPE